MTPRRTMLGSIAAMLVSGALLVAMLVSRSPRAASGSLEWSNVAIVVLALIILAGSMAVIVARLAHLRWPALAGHKRKKPEPVAAVRQGTLVGLVFGIFAVLALLQQLDMAVVLVVVAVAGLVEAYLQSRS